MTGIMRRSGLATVLLASGLVLAGCSDEEPQPPPKTSGNSPTAVTTSAAPVAAPTLPAAATADPEGAEAFVRYFWDVFNYTYASGDTKLLRSISDKSCKFCASTAADVQEWVSQGSHIEGGRVEVVEVVAPPVDVRKGALVYSVIEQVAGRVVAKDGVVVATGEPIPRRRSDVLVRYVSGRWQMRGVSLGGPGDAG